MRGHGCLVKKAVPQGGCKGEWNARKKDVCHEGREGEGDFHVRKDTLYMVWCIWGDGIN